MNRNWTRWIHASLSQYFTQYAKDNSLAFFIEASPRDTEGQFEWTELRWDGPAANEVSKNYWLLDVEINILISTSTTAPNSHRHKEIVGLIQAAYLADLQVYKYGDGQFDTQELLGCLRLRSDVREAIFTSYFGKIEVDVPLEQSTVEAHYRMVLNTKTM